MTCRRPAQPVQCNSQGATPAHGRPATMFVFGRGKRKWYWIATTGLICAVAALLVVRPLNTPDEPTPSLPKSFDAPSTSLRQTAIVPTLDTPVPEGKSAVWCASFQLAWDRLK